MSCMERPKKGGTSFRCGHSGIGREEGQAWGARVTRVGQTGSTPGGNQPPGGEKNLPPNKEE